MGGTKEPLSSSASPETTQHNPEAPDCEYAFLVHSQDTLSQQTGPDVDNRRLARQRRRRTSPEDHAILEAEYDRNSKPDKASRMELVNRVSLGEKEVQIWFQNRRQITRRKSRPLLPHEILGFHSSQEHSDTAVNSSFSVGDGSLQQPASSQSTIVNSQSTTNEEKTKALGTPSPVAVPMNLPPTTAPTASSATIIHYSSVSSQGSVKAMNKSISEHKVEGSQTHVIDLVESLSQTVPTKRRPGYFANRRSASFIIHDEHRDLTEISTTVVSGDDSPKNSETTSSHPLNRTASNVRLSLSLEGKAEVRTGSDTTPSPPRSQPIPLTASVPHPYSGLQRSYSAMEPSQKSFDGTFSAPYSRRAMTGRSRDARTWEFYCDSEVRNALTEQAEREESGSATAAISLIRSHSNKAKAMTPNLNKRNAQAQKFDSTKRLKADGSKTSKPKLGRATSSVVRLQTTSSNTQKRPSKDVQKHSKSNSQSAIYQDYDGDSDKENWEPGTQTSHQPRRGPVQSRQATRILEESLRIPSQSSSLDALMSGSGNTTRRLSGKTSSSEGKENGTLESKDEIATFMDESVPREVEDLDCVQNLLSLSQAAWQ